MEDIKNLLLRFRQSGILILIGFFLIIYIAFGFVYWQQSSEQKKLGEQSANISNIVAKELPNKEELQAKYDKANIFLAAMTDSDAIAILVSIAEKSGIDTDPDSDKLRIPSASVREETVGEGTYQVYSFSNVSVQGDYNSVMAFISDLDSGTTQETMVLKSLTINKIEVEVIEEEPELEPEPEPLPEPEAEPEVEIEPEPVFETVATLDVDLYTKPGGDGS